MRIVSATSVEYVYADHDTKEVGQLSVRTFRTVVPSSTFLLPSAATCRKFPRVMPRMMYTSRTLRTHMCSACDKCYRSTYAGKSPLCGACRQTNSSQDCTCPITHVAPGIWLFDGWMEYFDNVHGQAYYHNMYSNTTTWCKPDREEVRSGDLPNDQRLTAHELSQIIANDHAIVLPLSEVTLSRQELRLIMDDLTGGQYCSERLRCLHAYQRSPQPSRHSEFSQRSVSDESDVYPNDLE